MNCGVPRVNISKFYNERCKVLVRFCTDFPFPRL